MIHALDGLAPDIAADAWVAADANVIGRVLLGAGASVWFGATLRGDNEAIDIGPGSNVQEGCILHTDMGFPLRVGRDCTIGHRAILHGCTIGDETLVGMGAVVLNGAVIGRNCLIGAGALVTEGKQIPDGSLVVGAPARVVRPLDAEAIEGLRRSARSYRANAARFRAGLTQL
jgi:carbonic anhydrase/acetyltransferase-like protein (isoleucine patch superfamily)